MPERKSPKPPAAPRKGNALDNTHTGDDFDRQAYLREVRQNILKNLGLPEDTKPDEVMRLLEIKQKGMARN